MNPSLGGDFVSNNPLDKSFFKHCPKQMTTFIHTCRLKGAPQNGDDEDHEENLYMADAEALGELELEFEKVIIDAIPSLKEIYLRRLKDELGTKATKKYEKKYGLENIANSVVIAFSDELNPVSEAVTLDGISIDSTTADFPSQNCYT